MFVPSEPYSVDTRPDGRYQVAHHGRSGSFIIRTDLGTLEANAADAEYRNRRHAELYGEIAKGCTRAVFVS